MDRSTRGGLVVEAVEAEFQEPLAPLADGDAVDTHARGDLIVAEPLGAGQDDPGSRGEPLRRGGPPGPGFEGAAFVVGPRGVGGGAVRPPRLIVGLLSQGRLPDIE